MNSSSRSFAIGVVAGMGVCAMIVRWRKRRNQASNNRPAPRRFGGAIRLRPDMYDRYTQLHDAVWEGVLDRMSRSHVRNFTLYYHRETSLLFSHFEWVGHWYNDCHHDVKNATSSIPPQDEADLFDADMRALASDPVVRQWWAQCEPCQEPFSQWSSSARPPSEGGVGDWWAPLICLGHCGHWPIEYGDRLRDPDFVHQNPNGQVSTQPKVISGRSSVNAEREQ